VLQNLALCTSSFVLVEFDGYVVLGFYRSTGAGIPLQGRNDSDINVFFDMLHEL
jgi:hypothetical protein